MKIMIFQAEQPGFQSHNAKKDKFRLDDSHQIGYTVKFSLQKAWGIIAHQKETVRMQDNPENISVYLRLVNADGHPWTSTAAVKVLCQEAVGGKYYSQSVFRIPQWQPAWFIDVTDIVRSRIAEQIDDLCLSLTGGTAQNEAVCLYGESAVPGFQPLLILCCDKNEPAPAREIKINTALWGLQHVYTHRDLSWSGSFVRNAQANMHRLTGNPGYLNALQTFYDSNLNEDGGFYNISEEYFYTGANGSALLYLYKVTGNVKYAKALHNLKKALLEMPKSELGIITAGDRTEAELIFCVCDFLAEYAGQFDDDVCGRICLEQSVAILDLLLQGQSDGIPLQNIKQPYSKGWSRGMGWIAAGIGKILDCKAVAKQPLYAALLMHFKDLCYTLINYQNDNGMYRSIIYDVNKPFEVTGSGLIALGFEFGFQSGILPDIFGQSALKTLNFLPDYSKTGLDMSGCFPMNFYERYEVTDFSGNSDQGYGVWMELYSTIMLNMMRRANNEEYRDLQN